MIVSLVIFVAGLVFVGSTVLVRRSDETRQARHLAKMKLEMTWLFRAREAYALGELTIDEFEYVAGWLLDEGIADREREAGEFVSFRAILTSRGEYEPSLWRDGSRSREADGQRDGKLVVLEPTAARVARELRPDLADRIVDGEPPAGSAYVIDLDALADSLSSTPRFR